MASLSQILTSKPPCTVTKTTTSPPCPFFTRIQKRTRRPPISCTPNENDSNSLPRRDVLLGLGGLYGATNALTSRNLAFAAPIETQIDKCGPARLPNGAIPANCCPPIAGPITDFILPVGQNIKYRPAAHSVDGAYVKKFEAAIAAMRNLSPDDPRSFQQQMKIHCAYCNGTYAQSLSKEINDKAKEIQVHASWLFFPFHRAYLYFFERILGHLIKDPTFAIPYWAWDTEAGMKMPPMYTNEASSLYDMFRNEDHYPDVVLDLDYGGISKGLSDSDLIDRNYRVMNQQMISNSKTAEGFFGKPYKLKDDPSPGAGSIENKPHGNLHRWSGDPNQPNGEDMGNFYSAGRDPLFYAHHANVDRMWNIWDKLTKSNSKIVFDDYFRNRDWLDTSFLLYDENKNLQRITVEDCLDIGNMGYQYEEKTWPPIWTSSKYNTPPTSSAGATPSNFPTTLDKNVSVTIDRPAEYRNRTAVQKAFKEEVLSVGIEVPDRNKNAKFDVFVKPIVPGKTFPSLLAGSFSNIPSKNDKDPTNMKLTTTLTVGLTTLLDNSGADSSDKLEVKFIPEGDTAKMGLKINSASVRLIG